MQADERYGLGQQLEDDRTEVPATGQYPVEQVDGGRSEEIRMHVQMEAASQIPPAMDFADGIEVELGQERIHVEQTVVRAAFEIVEVEQYAATAG